MLKQESFIALRSFVLVAAFFFSSLLPAPVPELPELKKLPSPEPQGPLRKGEDQSTTEEMGADIKRFGEEVANRIDKVIKRKGFELWGDPWTVQGIPLIIPSPDTGFNLGLHAILSDIRRQDPHKVQILGQVLASDRGRYKHFLQLDYPHLLEQFRVTGRVSYNRDINFKYYGIGNETTVDPTGLEKDSPLYQNTRTGPGVRLQVLRQFGKNFQMGPLFGLKWTEVDAPAGSLLSTQNPVGTEGGRTHYVGWAFVYQTLDFEPYPTTGDFLELYINRYAPWTGSSFDFWRTTATYRTYVPLHPKLVFAHRTLFEVLSGNVPFFEMGAVGGSDSTIGFGGDRFMRGYDGNRFIDHIRFVMGFELRWDPIRFGFANQDIVIGFVPFIDLGKVWARIFPLATGTLHASTGWGTRIIWDKRLVLRTDFAVNQEGTSFYIELGHSF